MFKLNVTAIAAMLSAFSAVTACQTTESSGLNDSNASRASTTPVIAVEGAGGSPAAALYNALRLNEVRDGASNKKVYTGALIVHCSRSGSGSDAQARRQAMTASSCAANAPLPVGAQGLSRPAFLNVQADVALAVWAAFKAEEQWRAAAGIFEKVFESTQAELICAQTAGYYRCTVGALGSAKPTAKTAVVAK